MVVLDMDVFMVRLECEPWLLNRQETVANNQPLTSTEKLVPLFNGQKYKPFSCLQHNQSANTQRDKLKSDQSQPCAEPSKALKGGSCRVDRCFFEGVTPQEASMLQG